MPPALFVEVDDRNLSVLDSSDHALITHLEQAGYETHELAKDGPPRKRSQDGFFPNCRRTLVLTYLLTCFSFRHKAKRVEWCTSHAIRSPIRGSRCAS